MGTPGVPFDIPREHIVQLIKKKKGVVTQICKDLDICYHTFQRHVMTDPELKALLDLARNDYKQTICDMAETALMRALNQKEDLPSALSSAKFVLNNQGKERGYNAWNEEKQMNALSGLQQYWKDHEIKPEMMERFEAYCKTLKSEADAESKPGDKAD